MSSPNFFYPQGQVSWDRETASRQWRHPGEAQNYSPFYDIFLRTSKSNTKTSKMRFTELFLIENIYSLFCYWECLYDDTTTVNEDICPIYEVI